MKHFASVSCSAPFRLTALALMFLALALATTRVVKAERGGDPVKSEGQVVLSELRIPVEIIEAGEAPAVLEIRVQP